MFADDIIFLLQEAGLGTPGDNLVIGPRPVVKSDQATLSVVVTGGRAPEGTHNSTDVPAYVRPSAQIVCRAPTYIMAEAQITKAYEALFKVRNRHVNGTWYRQITINQEPFPIGEDDNNLIRFVFNIDVVKRYSPATS